MTEHDRGFTQERLVQYRETCAKASSEEMLVVPGIEYSDPTNTVHILTWGNLPFFGENIATSSLLQLVSDADGVAVLAHPTRREAFKSIDEEWFDRLSGIEIWNRKTDGWAPSRTIPSRLKGRKLTPFVGLDFHNWRQFFPLSLELHLEGSFTEQCAVAALKSNAFVPTAFGFDLRKLSQRAGALSSLAAAEKLRRTIAFSLRSCSKRRA